MSGGGIRGRVYDHQRRPVAGASVTWVDDGETASTTTAGDGQFAVYLEKVGPVSTGKFTVSLEGYMAATDAIGDGPYECLVTLQPAQAPGASSVSCRNME
jgi:hypothetical protein